MVRQFQRAQCHLVLIMGKTDLPPFLQKPVSLPGSVGDESAGRDQIDDPPTPSSKGPMTPSSKGNGSKNSADRSAISDVSSDGQVQ